MATPSPKAQRTDPPKLNRTSRVILTVRSELRRRSATDRLCASARMPYSVCPRIQNAKAITINVKIKTFPTLTPTMR